MAYTQQQIDETQALLRKGDALGAEASQQTGIPYTPLADQPKEQTVLSTAAARPVIQQTQQSVTGENTAIANKQAQDQANQQIKDAQPPPEQTPPEVQAELNATKTPEDLAFEQSAKDYESAANKAGEFYDNMAANNTAATNAYIAQIKASYNERRAALEESNKNTMAIYQQAGFRGGAARYATELNQNFLAEEERQGQKRLADLDAAYLADTNAATQALQQKNYALAAQKASDLAATKEKIMNEMADRAKQARDLTFKIQQANADAKAKALADQQEMEHQAAIGDAITQTGVTDPMQIFAQLRAKGMTVTPTQVADAVKSLKTAETVAPGIVGEWMAAIKADPTLKGMTLEQYLNLKDPTRALDLQEQKLRIAKIQQDLSKGARGGIDADPYQLLAYAQQYAATGQIPVGLPKGTFGIVAQAAKEMPQGEGALIDVHTGIKSSRVTGTQADGIVALKDLVNKLNEAKSLYTQYHHGILSGALNLVVPSKVEQQYNNLKGEIVDLLARARTGAAINASEERMYAAKLPGDFNKIFGVGASGTQKLDSLQSSLKGKLTTNLQTNGLAIYGFSKVKVSGKEYTVGDVVTNSKGQSGRVNADGSITIIE